MSNLSEALMHLVTARGHCHDLCRQVFPQDYETQGAPQWLREIDEFLDMLLPDTQEQRVLRLVDRLESEDT